MLSSPAEKWPQPHSTSMSVRGLAGPGTAVFSVSLHAGPAFAGNALDSPVVPPPSAPLPQGPRIAFIAVGAGDLVRSAERFAPQGKGGLNPLSPPQILVTSGPFAWTRSSIAGSYFLAPLGSLPPGIPLPARPRASSGPAGPPPHVRSEETVLETRFGEAYRAYQNAVQR